MGGYHSEKTSRNLDLRANEVESHLKGQQVEVRFDKQMYRRSHLAI
jgi:hypothetical protein